MDAEPANTQLVAVTPGQLAPAQRNVADWCRAKIVALSQELKEQRENLTQAKNLKWKHSGWVRAVTRTKARMVYYAKIQQAVRAGYLIVPNFDIDVIAVRVNRDVPPEPADVKNATPQILPAGVGRYVDDKLKGYEDTSTFKRQDGSEGKRTTFYSTGYSTDLDFPATLVKPAILEATDRAMALNLFDRIGLVRKGRRSDPIVVGQILDPRQSSWMLRNYPKCVTFFVAWWLDTKDL